MSELVVEVSADARWVPLVLEGEVDDVAAETAAEVLRSHGEDAPPAERVGNVVALLAGLSRHAQATDDDELPLVAAFVLMPETDLVPLTIASLRVTDGADSLDDLLASLVAPAAGRYDEPHVTTLDTPLGTAGRLTQRLVAPDATVREWLGAVWLFEPADAALLLSATFEDLVEAAEWADAFDDLARAVTAWVEE